MPLTPAEKQRRYRDRLRAAKASRVTDVTDVTDTSDGDAVTADPAEQRRQAKRQAADLARQMRKRDRANHQPPPLIRLPGRPSTYSPERGADICSRLLAYGTVRQLVKHEPNMPDEWTVYDWVLRYPEFAQNLMRARGAVMHRWVEDLTEITDADDLDPLDKRVRVDTRKWLMGRLLPQVFGDKLTLDAGAGLGGLAGSVSLGEMSDAELDALENLARVRLAEQGKTLDDGQGAESPAEDSGDN